MKATTIKMSGTRRMRPRRRGGARVVASDDYLSLVRKFPLRPIQTSDQYDAAMAILRDLFGRSSGERLTSGEQDYRDVLAQLVRQYDEGYSSLLMERKRRGRLEPIELLKMLMEEHRMNSVDLGKLVGGSGMASVILNGKRELSKAHIRTLAAHFKINPGAFL